MNEQNDRGARGMIPPEDEDAIVVDIGSRVGLSTRAKDGRRGVFAGMNREAMGEVGVTMERCKPERKSVGQSWHHEGRGSRRPNEQSRYSYINP